MSVYYTNILSSYIIKERFNNTSIGFDTIDFDSDFFNNYMNSVVEYVGGADDDGLIALLKYHPQEFEKLIDILQKEMKLDSNIIAYRYYALLTKSNSREMELLINAKKGDVLDFTPGTGYPFQHWSRSLEFVERASASTYNVITLKALIPSSWVVYDAIKFPLDKITHNTYRLKKYKSEQEIVVWHKDRLLVDVISNEMQKHI